MSEISKYVKSKVCVKTDFILTSNLYALTCIQGDIHCVST